MPTEVWKGLVDLGVPGIGIPRSMAGSASRRSELCVVAEEVGRAAAPVPFDTSVVLATEALKLAGSDAQKKKWLPARFRQGDRHARHRRGPAAAQAAQHPHDLRRRPAQRQEGAGGRRRAATFAVVLANTGGQG